MKSTEISVKDVLRVVQVGKLLVLALSNEERQALSEQIEAMTKFEQSGGYVSSSRLSDPQKALE